jgi:PAS domain-containing protein
VSDQLQLGARRMTKPETTEAVIRIDAAGRYTDGNEAALQLLGVTLDELLTSPGDRFAMQPPNVAEQAAFRAEWESAGSRPIVGTAGLKRGDGATIRVSYAIEADDSGFVARLWEVPGSPEAPPSVFSVGEVLSSWRAAERELAELKPGTPEWARTLSEIELLRDRYRELFRTVRPHSDC